MHRGSTEKRASSSAASIASEFHAGTRQQLVLRHAERSQPRPACRSICTPPPAARCPSRACCRPRWVTRGVLHASQVKPAQRTPVMRCMCTALPACCGTRRTRHASCSGASCLGLQGTDWSPAGGWLSARWLQAAGADELHAHLLTHLLGMELIATEPVVAGVQSPGCIQAGHDSRVCTALREHGLHTTMYLSMLAALAVECMPSADRAWSARAFRAGVAAEDCPRLWGASSHKHRASQQDSSLRSRGRVRQMAGAPAPVRWC